MKGKVCGVFCEFTLDKGHFITEQTENFNINITLMGNHTLYTVGNWSLRINFQRVRNHAFLFVNWKTGKHRFGFACKYRRRTDDSM